MSVTLIQTPEKYTPGYNEQVFVTSGTTSGKNNYQYIFNIYDYTGTTKLVPSIKIPPRVGDGWAVFDAGRIIEAYLTSDIQILSNNLEGFKSNNNSYYPYKVKVGEEFDVSTTGVTSYPDQVTTSGVVYCWNAAYSFQEFADYNYQTRSLASTTKKFLTSIGDVVTTDGFKKIEVDENEWLYMINDADDTTTYMDVVTTDISGLVEWFYINNPYSTISGINDRRFLRCPVGTRNLLKVPTGSIAVGSGSLPIIKSTTKSYICVLKDSAFVSKSEAIYYRIPSIYYPNVNTKFDTYRLHFLNKFGGFDSVSFNKLSRVNESIERKQYKKLYGSTSGRWSYNNYDRGVVNYNTTIVDKLTLNSDWISEAESVWLEQLIASPEIYWDNGNELQSINITNTEHEKRKVVNEYIFNLTIEVEISQKRYTQRG